MDELQEMPQVIFSEEETEPSVSWNFNYLDSLTMRDIEARKLWLTNDIDTEVITDVVYSIFQYNAEDKGLDVEERKPIYLYISTPGGSVFDGLALCSAIQSSKTPVYGICVGECCSMGLIVYVTCHKRYAMPNSIFLMHEGFAEIGDNLSKAKERLYFEADTLADHIKNIILERTKLTKKQYADKYKQEWYFLADVSKEYGFTDYIVSLDCDIDEIV